MTAKIRLRSEQPQGEYGFRLLWRTYIFNAKERGILWGLTEDEFRELTKQNCHYCGIEPKQVRQYAPSARATPEGRAHSAYVYNGVDRVDSAQGYTFENCVPCCKRCNVAKNDMAPVEFYAWVDRIRKVAEAKEQLTLKEVIGVMKEFGVIRFRGYGFNVELFPSALSDHTVGVEAPTIDDVATREHEAREAVKEAFAKVKQVNQQDAEDLFWST